MVCVRSAPTGTRFFEPHEKQQLGRVALPRAVYYAGNSVDLVFTRIRGLVARLYDMPWIYCFDASSDKQCELALDDHLQEGRERDQRLVCRKCLSWITSSTERIILSGGHAHTFTNPLGISFQIGCFQSAPGCSAHGVETLEHTWFSGYSWRMTACGSCGNHLGWRYYGSDKQFYGLILSQLVEADEGRKPDD